MESAKPDIEARLHLVRENRTALAIVLSRAALGGLEPHRGVAIIADTRDPVGHDIAKAACAKTTLDLQVHESGFEDRGEIPTAIFVVPMVAARELFKDTHPSVAAGLDKEPPSGCVRCVAIAAGAATLLHLQVRPSNQSLRDKLI